jgi:hypothetical protein
VIARLNQVIAEIIIELNRAGMSGDGAQRLPEPLCLARYHESAAELAVAASAHAGGLAGRGARADDRLRARRS